MASKEVPFSKQGIEKLPDDKPVLYRIETEGGKTNCAGVAKRGRVQERLAEHLPGGKDVSLVEGPDRADAQHWRGGGEGSSRHCAHEASPQQAGQAG
jgi:hypothetical protein